jgi:hypothetical protein
MGGGRGSFHCVTTYIIVAPAAAKSGGGLSDLACQTGLMLALSSYNKYYVICLCYVKSLISLTMSY